MAAKVAEWNLLSSIRQNLTHPRKIPIAHTFSLLQFSSSTWFAPALQIRIRRSDMLTSIYLGFIGLIFTAIFLIHRQALLSYPMAIVFSIGEIVAVGILFSIGPFLYALMIRNRSFFHEHTMAGLTHELKSPLAAIQSALDVLNERVKGRPEDIRSAEYVQMVERNTIRLRTYIDDLLKVFIGRGKLARIDFAPTNLTELLQRVVDSYAGIAEEKGIKILKQFGSSPLVVSCDSEKIEQAISNLLSNALKFTGTGWIRVSLVSEKKEIKIVIEDSGCGIPIHELPYVFDRFFQGTAGRNARGTGIGLAIAKLWIEAHGGEIGVESAGEGRGSKFSFVLLRREVSDRVIIEPLFF